MTAKFLILFWLILSPLLSIAQDNDLSELIPRQGIVDTKTLTCNSMSPLFYESPNSHLQIALTAVKAQGALNSKVLLTIKGQGEVVTSLQQDKVSFDVTRETLVNVQGSVRTLLGLDYRDQACRMALSPLGTTQGGPEIPGYHFHVQLEHGIKIGGDVYGLSVSGVMVKTSPQQTGEYILEASIQPISRQGVYLDRLGQYGSSVFECRLDAQSYRNGRPFEI